jgi:serine-type D-Ala-D-Ala endopeptidase (penicillin-binding protein 7)
VIESLAENWAFHMAHALWQTTLAAAVVLVLLRVMRNSSPRLRHALASIVFLKFVLPPMLPLPTGAFSAAPPVPELTGIRDAVNAVDPRVTLALMLLHATGIAIALTRLGLECWTLRGIRRRATSADGYLLSDEIAVPLTTGIFRPVILIPMALVRSLSPAELRDVLAHETQHVRNRDVFAGALQSVVVALWWFHPLAHWLASEARTLREERCDDALLAHGTCDRGHYARTLLNAATFLSGRTPSVAAAIAESPHSLLRRVRRMADARFTPSLRLGAASILLVIALALVLLPGLRISAGNRFAFDHATRHALHH